HHLLFMPIRLTAPFFVGPLQMQDRVVAVHQRQPDGSLLETQQPFHSVRFYGGGGGLYSTARDYLRFERMLLGAGKFGDKRILQSQTVAEMTRNQIGELTLPEIRSLIPQIATDPIRIPGSLDKF